MRVLRDAGGEDGAVKLLDVLCEHPRRSSSPQAASNPAREAFHRPYAKIVQTLPSHESSVGALAVGMCGRGGAADEIGCSKDLESTLVVSGGGNMEARAWRMDGGRGRDGSDASRHRGQGMNAVGTPRVSCPYVGV